jgi:hypothetical protein
MVAVGSASATMKTSTTLKPFFTIITSATCMPNLQGTSQLQQLCAKLTRIAKAWIRSWELDD